MINLYHITFIIASMASLFAFLAKLMAEQTSNAVSPF
jgi:hypothetical protein